MASKFSPQNLNDVTGLVAVVTGGMNSCEDVGPIVDYMKAALASDVSLPTHWKPTAPKCTSRADDKRHSTRL